MFENDDWLILLILFIKCVTVYSRKQTFSEFLFKKMRSINFQFITLNIKNGKKKNKQTIQLLIANSI